MSHPHLAHAAAPKGRDGKIMRTWFFPKGTEPVDLLVRSPQPDLSLALGILRGCVESVMIC